ncbi:integrase [Butyrivibrio sp. INlla14]|uniref:integrase n=1 Tax=Butyrivibrio sp. INlla14 TaxID=1520808 RepID=UPI000876C37A|nr:integrase [Butyrivibrio sp. INlla14]SCY14537.1 hypothetical protein SAMN02910371_01211 [Butyrivibrio sp. INlla14]
MSEDSQINEKVRGQVEIIEDDSFSYDDFQVVRGEFFAHVFEPSITFAGSKVYVNTACIKKMPETDYIQILINKEKKKLVVRPCREDERDSFRWCSATAKRSPKQVTCRPFFAMLCDEMKWDSGYRYKFLGKMIRSNGESLFLFDLSAPEIYLREVTDDGKIKNSRKPSFPEQWQNQFGIPASQHAASTKLNVFDGYTVFSIADEPKAKSKKKTTDPAEADTSATPETEDTKTNDVTAETASAELSPKSNAESESDTVPENNAKSEASSSSPPPPEETPDSEQEQQLTQKKSTDNDKEQQYEQITLSDLSS